MGSEGTEFEAARPLGMLFGQGGRLTLPKTINHVIGATATLLTRPGDEKFLVFAVMAGTAALGFRVRPGDYVARLLLAPDATGGVEENVIVLVDHGYTSGDGPYKLTEGTTLPSGVDETTLYWVGVVDTDTFALYIDRDAAVAATTTGRVALVDDGAGDDHSIGGMPVAVATTTDGYGSVMLSIVANDVGIIKGSVVLAAPEKITVQGLGAGSNLAYWWLP